MAELFLKLRISLAKGWGSEKAGFIHIIITFFFEMYGFCLILLLFLVVWIFGHL